MHLQSKSKYKKVPKHIGVYTYAGKGGRVCYYINYPVFGKVKWEKVGWKDEGVSLGMAVALRGDRVRSLRLGEIGGSTLDKKITLDHCFQEFIKWEQGNGNKDIERDRMAYIHHLKPHIGRIPMATITTLDIERLKPKWVHVKGLRKGQPLAPATITYNLTLLSRIYNRMAKLGIFTGENPVNNVERKRYDNTRVRFLEPNEAYQLLEVLKQLSHEAYLQAAIGLLTGLRKFEILGLHGRDIDLVNKRLTVIETKDSKEARGRIIPLNEEAIKLFASIPMEDHKPLFRGWNPYPHKRAIELCKLNDGVTNRKYRVSFHTYRHTYASWSIQNGTDLYTLSKLMGHKNVNMTQRYAHLAEDNLIKATNTVGNYFPLNSNGGGDKGTIMECAMQIGLEGHGHGQCTDDRGNSYRIMY